MAKQVMQIFLKHNFNKDLDNLKAFNGFLITICYQFLKFRMILRKN